VTHCAKVVVEVIGEGRADLGLLGEPNEPGKPVPPNQGVVPILVHKLCGKPDVMLVKPRPYSSLQGKTRAQKVQFAKRQSLCNNSAGVVFVLDSEGDLKGRQKELNDGRNREHPQYPMAVGIAHPCIEAWLLADAPAIRRAFGLSQTPVVPESPEDLPAPAKDRNRNPKTVLRDVVGREQAELGSKAKDQIAGTMNDMALVRDRCPSSFAPFADEIKQHIRPLFEKPCSPA
jgi:hypothetical protein